MTKKLVCMLLCLLLSTFLSINTFAQENVLIYDKGLIEALNETEDIKDKIGLKNVDFSKFKIASPIQCYEYTEQGLIEIFEYYPLLINEELTAFAILTDNSLYPRYTISTNLVSLIKNNITSSTEFAIIYDKTGCKLYNGSKIINIINYAEKINERKSLTSDFLEQNSSKIKFSDLSNSKSIVYNQTRSSSSFIYCNVDYVTQLPHDKICWAASIASISNYLSNKNLTAIVVATARYGLSFNHKLETQYVPSEILTHSGYSYPNVSSSGITAARLSRNIGSGYPVYGGFQYFEEGHASVIYGINESTTFFTVMDPLYGFSQGRFYEASDKHNVDAFYYMSDYHGYWMWLNRTCTKYL